MFKSLIFTFFKGPILELLKTLIDEALVATRAEIDEQLERGNLDEKEATRLHDAVNLVALSAKYQVGKRLGPLLS